MEKYFFSDSEACGISFLKAIAIRLSTEMSLYYMHSHPEPGYSVCGILPVLLMFMWVSFMLSGFLPSPKHMYLGRSGIL